MTRLAVVRQLRGSGDDRHVRATVHFPSCFHVDHADSARVMYKTVATLQKWERVYGDLLQLEACRDCGPLWH